MTIPMASAYTTSKAALKTFTQHLRMELAPFGIEVTNLEPGGVDTAMTETGPEAGAQQWALIPEPLREQYRRHFLDGATAIADNFTFRLSPHPTTSGPPKTDPFGARRVVLAMTYRRCFGHVRSLFFSPSNANV